MPDQAGELLAIMRDVLTRARLDNRERIRQMVLEEKAALESRLVPAGSSYVDRRLRANFHEADWADEQMGGVSYLFFLRELAERVDTDWAGGAGRARAHPRDAVRPHRDAVQRHRRRRRIGAVCSRSSPLFSARLPRAGRRRRLAGRRHAALRGPDHPGQVNYVGKGADLYELGVKPSGAHLVVRRYLNTT